MPKPERPAFASEAELCASFAAEMTRQGWTPYPETSGWDLLLVGRGTQVGIEAKLRPSLSVLAQYATRLDGRRSGPEYACILVPFSTHDFDIVAGELGAMVVKPRRARRWSRDLRENVTDWLWDDLRATLAYRPVLHFDSPAWVPPVTPDTTAGASAPVRLTPWKVSALRLVARLELRGWVTVADFRDLGLHPSRWYHHWLLPEGTEKPQKWVRRPGVPLPDGQHPESYAAILENERAVFAGTVHTNRLPLLDGLECRS